MNKLLFVFIFLCGCSQQYRCDIDTAFSDVTPVVEQANVAFKSAEDKILNIKPDEILKPDPDPAKCICKGTGLIRHGDEHVTKCPYHGNSTTTMKR